MEKLMRIEIDINDAQAVRLLNMLRTATDASHGVDHGLNNEVLELVEDAHTHAVEEAKRNYPYTSRGYKNQEAYYRNLSYINDLDLSEVYRVSGELGEAAEFTELPNALASIAHDDTRDDGSYDA